ncbi:Hypothetical protein PHPALM_2099, partial [Phytophthora palmivora]
MGERSTKKFKVVLLGEGTSHSCCVCIEETTEVTEVTTETIETTDVDVKPEETTEVTTETIETT